jgi:hypothetical protein
MTLCMTALLVCTSRSRCRIFLVHLPLACLSHSTAVRCLVSEWFFIEKNAADEKKSEASDAAPETHGAGSSGPRLLVLISAFSAVLILTKAKKWYFLDYTPERKYVMEETKFTVKQTWKERKTESIELGDKIWTKQMVGGDAATGWNPQKVHEEVQSVALACLFLLLESITHNGACRSAKRSRSTLEIGTKRIRTPRRSASFEVARWQVPN